MSDLSSSALTRLDRVISDMSKLFPLFGQNLGYLRTIATAKLPCRELGYSDRTE